MKLSDLKINRQPLDHSRTKEIISRVASLIEEAEKVKVDSMEGEADDGRYIELDLLIPSDANDEQLKLPVDFSGSSTENEDSSSESESEFREIIMPSQVRLSSAVLPPCTSRKLIEELKSVCTDDCVI
ncbi:unnamed protein product [Schistosoma margrebowiei]|uniref:Uncharacterized protein n=1 Tax=Schistosoma margrebowiei TaxID=48269 RepID=A0AA84ZNU8_9TREM|nr:unnamed protein product [Schistosoma margrebowiei]